jgi:succinate dehydrogenase flavin-adding protein (antitoxin of CptAB toxin-antitoxin module)
MSTTRAFEHMQLAAQLADLKQDHYQTLLTLNGLLAILTNKGIINDRELSRMMQRIDHTLDELIADLAHPKALADQQK